MPLLTKTNSNVVFEVICPSIPGYGYSEAPHKKGKFVNIQWEMDCDCASATGIIDLNEYLY